MPSKEQQSKVHRLFGWIGFFYVVVVVVYLSFRQPLELYLTRTFTSDFSTGFSSAFAENLFFYALGLPIAYFSILLSMADPKDSSFETRVKALTNSDKILVDDELYNYLKTHFTTFLAFTKKNKIDIEIRDYDEEAKAYFIYAKTDSVIANMCKDNDFVTTDAKARIVPDVQVKNEWGTVIRFETYKPASHDTISSAFTYKKVTGKFEEKIKIDIPKNEEIGLIFEYILWSKAGNDMTNDNLWYFFQNQRYTRSVELTVTNALESKKRLKFDARCSKSKVKDVTLEEDDKQGYIPLQSSYELQYNAKKSVIYKGDVYPGDRLEFFFHEPY